ncbi:hypothetical protein AN220_28335, partial [Streptomyces nanshensis]
LDVRSGYFDLGIESAQVLELVAAVGELVGESQSPTLLFEYTTVRALAAHLAPRYPHVFDGAAPRTSAAEAAGVPVAHSAAAPTASGTTAPDWADG